MMLCSLLTNQESGAYDSPMISDSHVSSLQTMADVWDCYHWDLAAVEDQILSNIGSDVPLVREIATFVLQGEGKRVRPLLLLLSARLCGCQGHEMHALASFVEYIHTATLLHDDVVDDAGFRRGKEAAHRLWGNQSSILVGDYLYTKAVRSIVDFRIHELNSVIAESVQRMTEGEIMQISLNCHKSVLSQTEYIQMVERKTGALIAAACQMGAILADADASDQEALFQFGLLLGTAYQIVDDMLDYVGQGDRLGKTLGNDIRQGKITLPLLHLLHHVDEIRRGDVQAVLEQSHVDHGDIERIVALMNEYGSVQYSMTIAREYVDKAKSALVGFGESTAKQALYIAANYMTTRDH
ncbi:MAG: hypothetical protein CMH81_02645 [Nitrospiraceae bacterium]|nr:hypothetical protein [Nitrospiraceae bacterium]